MGKSPHSHDDINPVYLSKSSVLGTSKLVRHASHAVYRRLQACQPGSSFFSYGFSTVLDTKQDTDRQPSPTFRRTKKHTTAGNLRSPRQHRVQRRRGENTTTQSEVNGQNTLISSPAKSPLKTIKTSFSVLLLHDRSGLQDAHQLPQTVLVQQLGCEDYRQPSQDRRSTKRPRHAALHSTQTATRLGKAKAANPRMLPDSVRDLVAAAAIGHRLSI